MPELNPDPIPAHEPEAPASAQDPNAERWSFAHALLFSGHMIDEAGRTLPRFPASAEGRAHEAIRQAIAAMPWTHAGPTIGLAGAASGGDILFHEACAELNIPTRILLALPVEQFVSASVAPAGQAWVQRFHALVAARGPENLQILSEKNGFLEADAGNIWQRANLWMIEQALALAPEQTLLALWDAKSGDGPGGTEHLVQAAPRFGVRIAPPIQIQKLQERTERP
jgi:hypothetical protein